jgi:hypothetical protein
MLNRSITTTLAALAIAGASVTAAYASEEALLDALVKKGVLKQADAQKIKAESSHHGSGGNSKIKLNESVKEMALYGDLRLRWQHAQGQAQTVGNPAAATSVASNKDQSARFRLAIGANVKLTDGVFAGVELITGSSPTDRFRTLGANDGGANNGTQDYSLNIGKAFVGWHATPEITIIAGRQGVPFYSTEMVWDNDVRLDGVSENVNLGKLLGFGEGFGLHFIAGQFITGNNQSYDSINQRANGRADSTDAWIYQAQLKAIADLGGAKLTVAPGILWANGATSNDTQKGTLGLDGLGENANTADVANNLTAILIPGDVSFDLAGTKAKFLWDFAYNFATTASRLNAATSATEDRMAWLAGFQLGQNHHKGDFSVFANWREVGAGAVNQGFSDSDFGLGFLNQRGYQLGTSYSLTSATKLSVTYSATNNIDQDATTSTVNSTHLATVQLGVKF